MKILNFQSTLLFLIIAAFLFVNISAADASIPLPQAVIDYMSARVKRYHHYLWHNIRDNWLRLSNSSKERITELGWAPPRPSRSYDAAGTATQILDNDAGEDFLYMHRSMISRFNSLSAASNDPYGKVVGWTTIPAPNDPEYPVPPNYTIPNNPSTTEGTMIRKSESFYTRALAPYEKTFKDPVQLRNMTLGQLGARIEATVHSYMHMRWSSNSTYGFRPSGSGVIPRFDTKWDDPQYNWLGDSYSSQLDPVFWKLHGWIDDRIEDWRKANNLSSIRWKGTWTGGPMSALSIVNSKTIGMSSGDDMDMDMDGEMDDTMPKVMEILLSEFPEVSFVDKVVVDDFVPAEYKPKETTGTKPCKLTKKSL